jgi:hypothetical protein
LTQISLHRLECVWRRKNMEKLRLRRESAGGKNSKQLIHPQLESPDRSDVSLGRKEKNSSSRPLARLFLSRFAFFIH